MASHGSQYRSRPRHVVLHLFHAVGGLDRDAAGIERDAFANQRQMRGRAGRDGLVLHHNQVRRLYAPLRDSEQRSHSERRHRVPIQNFAPEVELSRHLAGRLRQLGRSQQIGGFVDQIARKVLRLGDHHSLVQSSLERLGVSTLQSLSTPQHQGD